FEIVERRLGMLDPSGAVGPLGRIPEERAQVLAGAFVLSAAQQEERETVVRARERAVELEGAAIVAHGVFDLAGAPLRDGEALQNSRIVRMVAQGEPVTDDRGVEVALTLEGESFVQVV